uniref:Patched domain containing 3/pseudo n=1 Tax=Gallus gallus TaxID=9031 RepID=A0A8V0XQH8_CHICK
MSLYAYRQIGDIQALLVCTRTVTFPVCSYNRKNQTPTRLQHSAIVTWTPSHELHRSSPEPTVPAQFGAPPTSFARYSSPVHTLHSSAPSLSLFGSSHASKATHCFWLGEALSFEAPSPRAARGHGRTAAPQPRPCLAAGHPSDTRPRARSGQPRSPKRVPEGAAKGAVREQEGRRARPPAGKGTVCSGAAEEPSVPPLRGAPAGMGQPQSPRERCSCSNTNCVERPLTRLFEALGRVVAACPWPFVLLPPLLSAGLGAGFMFLPGRQTNDIEGQFTPTGGPAKAERDFVRRYFPTDDSERFSAERLPTEGAYAALIAVAAKDDASVLERAAWDEVLLLDDTVRDADYERLCARSGGTCASANPLLQLLTHANGSALPELPELPFPGGGGGGDAFLGTALGGVRTDGSGRVERARAVKLMYYLREDGGAAGESRAWLETFLNASSDLALFSHQVTYFTSLSRQEEFEGNTKSVIPLFSITYFLTITFSVVSCLRLSCVRNNIWLACCGVLSSGLAVLSSFGLMLYCGVPFVATVANAPFLILGVGVDDMFIMVSSWEQSSSKADKSDTKSRLAETYSEAALSVTITTLTDVLAFFIGTWTAFPSGFCEFQVCQSNFL